LTEAKYFGFVGGMDMVTPSIVVPPGRVRASRNYESSARGYKRIEGWERFDGRAKPSEATYKVITFSDGKFIPPVGGNITGSASGKTAYVLASTIIQSGSASNGDAVGTFPIMEDTGLLQGETISFGGVEIGVLTSAPEESAAPSLEVEESWGAAARNYLRGFIQQPAGSGPIRGIAIYKGDVYAFRDNEAGTSGVMYKATTSGWSAIAFHKSISFDAGTSEFQVGETITQTTGSTPGATAVIRKVILQDGDWTTNDAVGRLIITSVVGTFQDNSTILSTSAGSATVNGTVSDITLPPGGRYAFDTNNFMATTGTLNLYGANGVGPAFEFDGQTLTPILTGEPNDTPSRIAAHADHLFLSYDDGRFIHSSIFKPLNFEIIQGALLGGIGEPITDLVPTATGELAIFGENKVGILYGTNSENWQLKTLTNESGAQPWTTQLIGTPLYLDHVGVRSLDATQSYGNFSLGTKTQMVQPHIESKSRGSIKAVGSMRIRSKDMYRLFWSDGSGLSIYFGRKQPEAMLFNLDFVPSCTVSGEDSTGREVLFLGSTDGDVYQMDSGTSADGDVLVSYLRIPFNHVGSPTNDKRWHKAVLEVDSASRSKLSITYSFSYGDTALPQASEKDFLVYGGGGLWNEANWNEFKWSSPIEGVANIYIDGIGQNMSLTVISVSDYHEPHTLHGVTLHYNYRRLVR
jgi:hypothetical protein